MADYPMTLIFEDDRKKPLCILMHGDREVSAKQLARAIGAKTVAPCAPEIADNLRALMGSDTTGGAMARDPKQLVGTTVANRYRVAGVLGGGGGGTVCEVVDAKTNQPAALKLVAPHDADAAGRLEREATALAQLSHPNIVAFVDSGKLDDGTPYLVTELIRGTSLRDALAFDVIEPGRALVIARQLLEALAHAHGVGMIHRDIKPENLMFVDGGPSEDFVKLIDFGVAKALDQNSKVLGQRKLTRAGLEVVGSPPYVAPEAAIGEPLDERTDLYAVGIMIYEMLSGRVPFQHEKTSSLLRMHVTEPVPKLRVAAASRELEQLVYKALAKEPDQRFASANEMCAEVVRLQAGGAPAPAPPKESVLGRALGFLRRR